MDIFHYFVAFCRGYYSGLNMTINLSLCCYLIAANKLKFVLGQVKIDFVKADFWPTCQGLASEKQNYRWTPSHTLNSPTSVLTSRQNFVKQNECYTLFEELDQGFIFNKDLGLISRSAMNRETLENKTKKKVFSHEIYVKICRWTFSALLYRFTKQ